MSETEQKKRRFVLYLFGAHDPIGIECNGYNWNVSGLVFYGSNPEESYNGFTVCGIAPEAWRSFYEVAEGDDWPDDVKMVFSEYGAMSRTSQGWIKCNPTR